MTHHRRDLYEDELLGWPNSAYRGSELITPLDNPILALSLDGGWRVPRGIQGDHLIRLKRMLEE